MRKRYQQTYPQILCITQLGFHAREEEKNGQVLAESHQQFSPNRQQSAGCA